MEHSMSPGPRALALIVIMLVTLPVYAGEFGINLYGLSYHMDRERARQVGLDKTFNPGVGVRYLIGENQHFRWFADAGIYRDSGDATAKLAGAAVQWKVTGSLGIGAALVAFDSPSYNRGRAFVAPLPVVSYELRAATLNLFYSPKLRELNEVDTFGLWITFWPGRW